MKLARPDATWQVATMVYELAGQPTARYVA